MNVCLYIEDIDIKMVSSFFICVYYKNITTKLSFDYIYTNSYNCCRNLI